jgi:mannose-6-phosphate isomerase-like protein (cupin superfamily)
MQTEDLRKLVTFSSEHVTRAAVHETGRLWSELVCLSSNQRWGPIRDLDSDAIFVVVAGEAAFQTGGRRKRVKQWSTVLVSAGEEMVATNASVDPLVLLVVAAPPPVPREVTG